MKKYHIVSALVRCKDLYLVARRSEKKRFAPGQWEFVSGFVDKNLPLEKIMLEELDEEFLIRDIVSIKRGEDFVVVDGEGEWKVTPFLIDVLHKVAILHPDEHSELQWVTLQELHNFPYLDLMLPGMLKLL